MPEAICEVTPTNTAPNVLMNPVPPFDDLDMRRAVAMALDRREFIDILTERAGDIGTALQPGPEGLWAMPADMRRALPGYDPDQGFPENYSRGSHTYMDYCNPELDKLIVAKSSEKDQEKRKRIVWEIDRRLQADAVRPVLFYIRAGTCHRPEVKGMTIMLNSTFNGWRMEDVWLDR